MTRAQRADATIEIVVEKAAHIYRILGATTPLEQITLAELEKYVDTRLAEGAHRGTIEREIRTLRQAWRAAKRSGLVDFDPPPSPDLGVVYTPKERWLPRDEVLRLLDALPAQWREHVIMYLHTGIRASELYRIRLADCDFDAGEIRVRGTKTEGADRVVAMTPEVRSILLSARSVPFAEPGDRLFRAWTNHDRDLKRACAKAQTAPCSLNDLRRTYATETARAGVPITTAAKLMGHTDTRMLSKVYAQVASEDRRSAAAKLPRYRETLCQICAENNGHNGNNEDNGGEKTA